MPWLIYLGKEDFKYRGSDLELWSAKTFVFSSGCNIFFGGMTIYDAPKQEKVSSPLHSLLLLLLFLFPNNL
jgi:hypothetical protein